MNDLLAQVAPLANDQQSGGILRLMRLKNQDVSSATIFPSSNHDQTKPDADAMLVEVASLARATLKCYLRSH